MSLRHMGDKTYERSGFIMIIFLGTAYGVYKGVELYFGVPWWLSMVGVIAICIGIFIQLLKRWDELPEPDRESDRIR